MASAFHSEVAVLGDENIKDVSHIGGARRKHSTSRPDLLLLCVPDPEAVVGVWIVEMTWELGRQTGTLSGQPNVSQEERRALSYRSDALRQPNVL